MNATLFKMSSFPIIVSDLLKNWVAAYMWRCALSVGHALLSQSKGYGGASDALIEGWVPGVF